MKVVLLSPSKSSHTHKWALFYKQQGIEVTVVTFKDHYSEENAKEVHTVVLPKLLPGKLSYLFAVSHLRKLLKELKPDILHAHFVSSYGLVGALTQFHPFYVSVWGTDIYQFPLKNTVNRRIVEYTLGKADVICSTSHIMAKETSKYTDKEIEVTPFGVDLSLFCPKKKEEGTSLKIGIAKGLDDVYGFRDLFQAFVILRSSFQELELMIVGDGPMREEYKEICRSLGIADAVHFIGRVPNHLVPNYLREMAVVVMPSLEESFGVTAVEAMACGVPVVVSNADGLKEVVKNRETGLIVSKENPDMLAKAVAELLNDEGLRDILGQNGVKHVRDHYDWQENAGRMIKLYRASIANSGQTIKNIR
ncbi:glycosyltransferase [Cytobacillus firmus]|uniref:glycosyltransferase n=1 Tax=Cytobacillus firmus TaxID=1399 RepID=UPI002162830D|nr:glycosyltransferase [Cytobacillus firmus]MCS0673424.1 glycosyltransferase [Cytobacillus firmus]